jgi:hypothetical protein
MNFSTPQVKHGREGVCEMECWDSQKSESSTTLADNLMRW